MTFPYIYIQLFIIYLVIFIYNEWRTSFGNFPFSFTCEYSMCALAGGMWRWGWRRRGLRESALTPSLSSRFTASHLSPALWPAACRQALANLTLLPLLPSFFFSYSFSFTLSSVASRKQDNKVWLLTSHSDHVIYLTEPQETCLLHFGWRH